jgi:hypothetical protein
MVLHDRRQPGLALCTGMPRLSGMSLIAAEKAGAGYRTMGINTIGWYAADNGAER